MLEPRGPEFHFGFLQGIFVSLPRHPVHAISERRVRAKVIKAIQIWRVAFVIPPGSFGLHGAISFVIHIVIHISCSEGHVTLVSKRVASRSWKLKKEVVTKTIKINTLLTSSVKPQSEIKCHKMFCLMSSFYIAIPSSYLFRNEH
jgi:hypothetical protein